MNKKTRISLGICFGLMVISVFFLMDNNSFILINANVSKIALNSTLINSGNSNLIWKPCVPSICKSASSCGYFKSQTTINCPAGTTMQTGTCLPMKLNRVVSSYQVGNGFYCKTACSGSPCFVTDGCAYVQCRTNTYYRIVVSKLGNGRGTVNISPSTISLLCGPDITSSCSAQSIDSGTAITLIAFPNTGSVFVGWSGSGCSGNKPCTITMNSSQTVSATFNRIPEPINSSIILFYRNGCPHCVNVDNYLKENNVEQKIKFVKKEISIAENLNLFNEKAKACGLSTDSIGVPFLWDGAKCYIGDQDVINFFKTKMGS